MIGLFDMIFGYMETYAVCGSLAPRAEHELCGLPRLVACVAPMAVVLAFLQT